MSTPSDDNVCTAAAMQDAELARTARLSAVGRMTAQVAHELNNPLDGILRYVNLALRQLPAAGNEKVISYLQQTRRGLLRMTRITTDLLEFSRNAPPTIEGCCLGEVVADAVRAHEALSTRNGVSIICRVHKQPLPGAIAAQMFQVFGNLIKNAIEAMPDGGTLRISSKTVRNELQVCFEDTGNGLGEHPQRIFEPFYTTKVRGEGSGLGLAICKEILEHFKGSIEAANSSTGGAGFVVRLPCDLNPKPSA